MLLTMATRKAAVYQFQILLPGRPQVHDTERPKPIDQAWHRCPQHGQTNESYAGLESLVLLNYGSPPPLSSIPWNKRHHPANWQQDLRL